MKRYLLILVSFCLALSLLGCQTETPSDTSTASTTLPQTTPPTTQPAPDAAALYAQAISSMPTDLTVTLQITRQVSIGGSVYGSVSNQTVTYLGLGSEAMTASVIETVSYGDYSADFSEIYTGGTVYATLCGEDFMGSMTEEEFAARYLPPVLLTAGLYSDVTVEGDTFSFSGASQPESWLLDAEADECEASGTVNVADGCITGAEYNASYRLGGTWITVSVTQTIEAPAMDTISAPDYPGTYLAIDSIDAPKLLDQVYGYMLQTANVSAVVTESIISQAAGYAYVGSSQMDAHITGDDPMYRVDSTFSEVAPGSTAPTQTTIEEIFRDGKYSVSTNGGREEPDADITKEDVQFYFQNTLCEVPETSCLASASLTDVGGILLAEFSGTEQYGKDMCAWVSSELFGTSTLLDELASSYVTNQLDFYVAVDLYTGLPTAIGSLYEGVHTIENMEYILSQQTDCSIDLGAMEAYKTITGTTEAEDAPGTPATPLLYRVSGADGQQMWLFGTIHVGDVRTGFLPQEFYDAFSASDALAIECDNTGFEALLEKDHALAQRVSEAYYYSDGTTVKDHFTDQELYEAALKRLKATGGYNANSQLMKPVLWWQTMDDASLRFGNSLTSCKGMEYRLEALAEAQNKPLREVESCIFQIEMLTGYSDALQEMLVRGTVESGTRESWESVQELYELWCIGNEADLIEAIREDTSEMTEDERKLYEEYDKAISFDRNVGMLEVAKEYLESGETVFFAVGLAHLLADNGLVFALRDAGYTVEPVTYAG